MSRMTRAEFLRLCTVGSATLVAAPWLRSLYAADSSPRLSAARVIIHTAEIPTDRAPVVTAATLAPDGQLLATAGDDHIVRLWRTSDGGLQALLKQHTDWVRATSFDPQGKLLATAGEDRVVHLWEVANGKLLRTLDPHELGIRSVRFSPDGLTIAATGFDQQVKTYDVTRGTLLNTFEATCPDMRTVAFSRTGEMLAAGGRDGRLRLYRPQFPNDMPTVSGHTQRMRALAFSPDGTLLATAGDDQQVLVWDLQTIKPTVALSVPGSKIMSLTWCGPRVIAAGGSDNMIHLLDHSTRQTVGVLIGHTGTIAALDADQAGRMLVSGSFDTTARIWNIEQLVTGSTTAQHVPLPGTTPTTTGTTPAVGENGPRTSRGTAPTPTPLDLRK